MKKGGDLMKKGGDPSTRLSAAGSPNTAAASAACPFYRAKLEDLMYH